jgi:hypothetical protein
MKTDSDYNAVGGFDLIGWKRVRLTRDEELYRGKASFGFARGDPFWDRIAIVSTFFSGVDKR